VDEFATIYREFQPKIRRYLRNLVGEADAPDLTQIVFLKVSRGLAGFRRESSIATWIYRIATNTVRDHRAAALAGCREAEQLLADADALDDLPDVGSPRTDREYIRREMNDCIRGLVDGLPENYRTVLLLSEFEELANREIAEILGLSLETVKVRLHRARAALRKAMEAQCSFYHDERSELMCDRKGKADPDDEGPSGS